MLIKQPQLKYFISRSLARAAYHERSILQFSATWQEQRIRRGWKRKIYLFLFFRSIPRELFAGWIISMKTNFHFQLVIGKASEKIVNWDSGDENRATVETRYENIGITKPEPAQHIIDIWYRFFLPPSFFVATSQLPPSSFVFAFLTHVNHHRKSVWTTYVR